MVLGVTGGVGVGKSTVLRLLSERFGFDIIRTDDVAKELMAPGSECLKALSEAFGEDILDSDMSLNKERYAALIYGSEANRKKSDSIVHPRVWREVMRRIEETDKDAAVETALPDARFYDMCDKVMLVSADKEVRIERLIRDRAYTREYCVKIIDSQLSDESFRACSDLILNNSGSIEDLEKEMEKLLQF